MIKNIVFDMGNVLLDCDNERTLNRFCRTQEAKDIIRRELFAGREWIEGDLGNITDAERLELVSRRVPKRYYEELRLCALYWTECILPMKGARELLDDMRKSGRGVYVLSNASDRFYEYFPRFYDMDLFDGIVVSSDLHIIKPDVRIYGYLLEKYGLNADECLFIDDRRENVQGAREAGMRAALFENNYNEIRKMIESN
ncbi:MAG: HAD family hydrolase [Acutalibacteraceae bacterium]